MADAARASVANKLETNELHKAAYEGNLAEVERLLSEGKVPIDGRDKHGNSPLSLAIHFKRTAVVKLLLERGADPTLKSKAGWPPIREALSSGSDELVRLVYRSIQLSMYKSLEQRLSNLKKGLAALPDFYLELDWEFKTWVPFLSRFCPSDSYKIWKKGTSLRADSTLVGYENLNWLRGSWSVIFDGDSASPDLHIIDHEHKRIESALEALKEDVDGKNEEDDIRELHEQELISTHANADTVKFAVSKSWLGSEKTEAVEKYQCKLYQLEGLQYRVLHRSLKDGLGPKETSPPKPKSIDHSVGDDLKVTWQSYNSYDNKGKPVALVYKNETLTVKEKTFKGTVYMTKDFPRKVADFLPIFEVLAPTHRGFEKLAEFIQGKLPDDGFPVKLELPVFPTVTGLATFKTFIENPPSGQLNPKLFALPANFEKSKINFKQE